MKPGNAHMRRTFIVLVLVMPLLASCQQSKIDELESQVSQLESENERLRSTLDDEYDVVTRLNEELDQTTMNLERLEKCLSATASAAMTLAVRVRALRNPDNVLVCCVDFYPGGACAYPADLRILRYMKRKLTVANEYLSEISRERFDALCLPGGSDPTDPRCFP